MSKKMAWEREKGVGKKQGENAGERENARNEMNSLEQVDYFAGALATQLTHGILYRVSRSVFLRSNYLSAPIFAPPPTAFSATFSWVSYFYISFYARLHDGYTNSIRLD